MVAILAWLSAEPWRWRLQHYVWAFCLELVGDRYGMVWYAAHETGQALAAKRVQWKNVLDFLPSVAAHVTVRIVT